MYFQNDYILRMIEMMGDMLRKLGDMLDERERDAELDRLAREYLRMPLSHALALSDDTLCALLAPRARFALSEILYVKAKSAVRMDGDEREALFLRALRQLASLYDDSVVCAHRAARLAELRALCAPSPDAHLACARFFCTAERFDMAEDAAFMAAEGDGSLASSCAVLFGSLLSLSEETLALGGFTRAEALEAIADLRALEEKA